MLIWYKIRSIRSLNYIFVPIQRMLHISFLQMSWWEHNFVVKTSYGSLEIELFQYSEFFLTLPISMLKYMLKKFFTHLPLKQKNALLSNNLYFHLFSFICLYARKKSTCNETKRATEMIQIITECSYSHDNIYIEQPWARVSVYLPKLRMRQFPYSTQRLQRSATNKMWIAQPQMLE